MPLVHEKFLNCGRDSDITAAHLNAGFAARIDTTASGADLANGKPGVNLCGTAADANEVFGEIKGAVNADSVTVQTGGVLYLRVLTATYANVAAVDAVVGQGVQAVDTGAGNVGFVEATGTLGTGFGRILGGVMIDGTLRAAVYAESNG